MKSYKLFAAWFMLKDKRTQLDAQYKADKADITAKQDQIKNGFDAIMSAAGTDQLKVKGVGVAFPEVKEKISCTDAAAFREFIVGEIQGPRDKIARTLYDAKANMYEPEIAERIIDNALGLLGCINDEAINLLNAAANQKNCRDWLEEEGELPDGLDLVPERVITVRKD